MPFNLGIGLGLSRRGIGGQIVPAITAFSVGPQSGTNIPVAITLVEGLTPPTAIYIVGVDAGSGEPSTAQIIAGQDSLGAAADVVASIADAATGTENVSVTPPATGTYDFYVVAVDAGAAQSNVASDLGIGYVAYDPSTDLTGYQFTIDPSDIGTLFTDTAGTTPVTAPGDLVACVRDPFTGSIVATQATSGNRPTYQVDSGGKAYLQMGDGVTARWLTGTTFDFTTTSINRTCLIFAHQIDATVTGARFFVIGGTRALSYFQAAASTITAETRTVPGPSIAITPTVSTSRPIKFLTSLYNSVPSDVFTARINKSQVGQNVTAQGGGTNNNGVPAIGARSTGVDPFNGRLYGLIFAANNSTDYTVSEVEAAENFLDTRLN